VVTAQPPQAESRPTARRSFRAWRRSRPFWGGLLMVLSGLALFLSSNLDLGAMSVKIGPQGFLSYVIPVTMLLCGVLTWVTPANRLFLSCIGLLVATYSVIGLNLGGFGVGLLLGILGGALSLAWTPGARAPSGTPGTDSDAGPDDASADGSHLDDIHPDDTHRDGARRDRADPAVGGPRSTGAPGTAHTGPSGEFPFFGDDERPPQSGGTHRSLFVIALIPTTLAAVALVLGGHAPAEAASCPVPTSARTATVQPAGAKPVRAKPVTGKPSGTPTRPAAETDVAAGTTPTPSRSAPTPTASTPTPAPSSAADLGAALRAAVADLAAAAGLGTKAEPTAGPEPTTGPEPTATPTPTPTPTPTQGTDPTPGPRPSTGGPTSGPEPDRTTPPPNKADIPCLGPRVFKTTTADDGMPMVSLKGGVITGTLLTMYGSTYDGVVELRTASGVVRALQFSMDKSVTKQFKLQIDEPGDSSTAITSSELTTDGNVKFYSTKFTGRLFGVIPVTFTPDAPPPLMLSPLSFADVVIDLAFVRCDTLTADAMKVAPV
jgi:hypothetical protein